MNYTATASNKNRCQQGQKRANMGVLFWYRFGSGVYGN